MKYFFLLIFLSSSIFAEELSLPKIKKPAPLTEGIDRKLSPTQVSELLPWAKDSKIYLNDLLSNVELLGSRDKISKLLSGIADVVSESAPAQNELFMRYALNRALVLVETLDREIDSNAVGSDDVKLRVLSESIAMAIQLFDVESEKNEFSVADFGILYFNFLVNLNKSVVDATAQYATLKMALEFYQWDLYRDLANKEYASIIIKINSAMRGLPDSAKSDREALVNLRMLKRVTREIIVYFQKRTSKPKCSIVVCQHPFSPQEKVVEQVVVNGRKSNEIIKGDFVIELLNDISILKVVSITDDGRALLSDGGWYSKDQYDPLVIKSDTGISENSMVVLKPNGNSLNKGYHFAARVKYVSKRGYVFDTRFNNWWHPSRVSKTIDEEVSGIKAGDKVLLVINKKAEASFVLGVAEIDSKMSFCLEMGYCYGRSYVDKIKY